MFTEKEKELLSTFSSKEDFYHFAVESLGQDIQDFIDPKIQATRDWFNEENAKGTFSPGSPVGNALIGAGVGAGVGGIYGAFKKKKKKGDVLKYALLGAGLGGLGGYAGTHAKTAWDEHRVNSLDKEIESLEQDPHADPNKIVELYNKRNNLVKDPVMKVPAELGLAKAGYIAGSKDGGVGLMAQAEQEYAKGNVKAAASLAKKAQFAGYGKNHPNYGKVSALPSDEVVLKELAQRKLNQDTLAEKQRTAALKSKVNKEVGALQLKKEKHEQGRNMFEKLLGLNKFNRTNKHWPAQEKTEEELYELLKGEDEVLSDWAAEELAAKQLGFSEASNFTDWKSFKNFDEHMSSPIIGALGGALGGAAIGGVGSVLAGKKKKSN